MKNCVSIMKGPSQNYSSNNYYSTYQPTEVNTNNGYETAAYNYYNMTPYANARVQDNQTNLPYNSSNNDFSEYTWMVDEDEVEKKMLEELEQEEYIEACLEQLWMDEMEEEMTNETKEEVTTDIGNLKISDRIPAMTVPRITLNPNAQEFVPRAKTIVAQ